MANDDRQPTQKADLARQTVLRRKISINCRTIQEWVDASHSRTSVQDLLNDTKAMLTENEAISDRLQESLAEDEARKQHSDFLEYKANYNSAAEIVKNYLDIRADDTPSVNGSSASRKIIPNFQRAQQQVVLQQLEDARETFNQRQRELAEAFVEAGGVLDEEPCFGQADNDSVFAYPQVVPRPTPKPNERVVPRTTPVSPKRVTPKGNEEELAPDDWIEIYYDGHEKPQHWSSSDRGSSVRIELEAYYGLALEWFHWIDLFRCLVHQTNKSPAEKLAILKKLLRGECASVVYGLGGGKQAYKEALMRLKEMCGSRAVMRAAHLQALEKLTAPRNDPSGLKRYAEKVRTHLFDLTRIGETGHADIIERLCQQLSINDRMAWNEGRRGGLEYRSLNQFGMWLCGRAANYQNAYLIATEQVNSSGSKHQQPPPFQKSHFNGQSSHQGDRRQAKTNHGSTKPGKEGKRSSIAENTPPPSCLKCDGEHRLETCSQFKSLSVGERNRFVQRFGLCKCCLGIRHGWRSCQRKKPCSVPSCSEVHHQLLHDAASKSAPVAESNPHTATITVANEHSARSERNQVALGVIPVQAVAENGDIVLINILVDEGSDSTLIREGLARKLNLNGSEQTLRVDGVGRSSKSYTSQRVQLNLKMENGDIVAVEASTLPRVTKKMPVVDWTTLRSRWSHLADLPLQPSGGKVDVLLGLDYAYLMAVLESRVGSAGEPIASRTRLGWIVRGVIGIDTRPSAAAIHCAHSTTDVGPQLLAEMRRFCDTESFGTEYQKDALSQSDRAAVEMLEKGLKKLPNGQGYEASVLWVNGERPTEEQFPSNRILAEHRLRSLLSKFRRDNDYEKKYRAAMQKNVDQGFSRRLTEAEVKGGKARYFLPHFSVYKKHSKKKDIRLVFDAAAKFRNHCINEYVLTGPKLQNPLPGVIIGFREKKIAWSTDIKSMYSKIRIPEPDTAYHCFLWPEEDGSVSVCQMTRLTFGVNCSPFVAIRTTWKAAEGAGPPFVDAADAIKKKKYVDDMMESEDQLDRAVAVEDIPALVKLEGRFLVLVKRCQQEEFEEEIERLQQKKPLKHSSRLRDLTPFLDENGILRLGG